jgi:hypothetical protein
LTHNIKLHHANFYFKIDVNGELVLLFTTQLKTEPIAKISSYSKSFNLKIPDKEMNHLIDHSDQDRKFTDSDFMFEPGDIGLSKSDCSIC